MGNTTGAYNTAIGSEVLISNTEGESNTAIGYKALYSNTTGQANTANGYSALYRNTSGISNTAGGFASLFKTTTGSRNTANGTYALFENTTGRYNTAYGYRAIYSNTTGNSNIAVGNSALYLNTDRSNLVAIGDSALYNNGIGAVEVWEAALNTAVGSKALYSNTTGSWNKASGFQALNANTTGYDNTGYGYRALYKNTTGTENTAIGSTALYTNTTGADNTAVGLYSLFYNTTGSWNTAHGTYALFENSTGNNNTADGFQAGYHLTGGNGNIFIGSASGPTSNQSIDSSMWLGNTRGNEPAIYGDLTDGQIGIGTTTPDPSAKLEVNSNNQGFLPPRMTSAEILSIANPATGLMVFDLDLYKLVFFNGTNWIDFNGHQIYVLPCPGTPTVIYGGQTYNTILIAGNQCWLKENLNVGTMIDSLQNMQNNGIIEKYCYHNNEDSCAKYGGLYQWNEIMQYNPEVKVGICPAGWHVPTYEDWSLLIGFVREECDLVCGCDNKDYIAKALAASTDWHYSGETCAVGNNLYINNATGFSGLPGGYRDDYGTFHNVGYNGNWWTSDSRSVTRLHFGSPYVVILVEDETMGFSVRCCRWNY